MPQPNFWKALVHYYETSHQVNEATVRESLQRNDVPLDTLSEDVLQAYDMDHYDGAEAVEILAQRAGIDATSVVLDVGSGLGGPARYLAYHYGCRVTGLDLTASRTQSARRLTALVKLDQRVAFCCGNALALPFAERTFDVVIGQEAWVHIPDKARLLQECARVLTPGGRIAFTDFLHTRTMHPADLSRLQPYWGQCFTPETVDGYRQLLAAAGLTLVEWEDVSQRWTIGLTQRAEAVRRTRLEIVQHCGEEHYRLRLARREILAEMYTTGKMGGGRFIARLESLPTP